MLSKRVTRTFAALRCNGLYRFGATVESGGDETFHRISCQQSHRSASALKQSCLCFATMTIKPLKSGHDWHVAPAAGDWTPAGLTPFDLVLVMGRIPYRINYSSPVTTRPRHARGAVCFCGTVVSSEAEADPWLRVRGGTGLISSPTAQPRLGHPGTVPPFSCAISAFKLRKSNGCLCGTHRWDPFFALCNSDWTCYCTVALYN